MPWLKTFALDKAISVLSARQRIANVAWAFNVNSATVSRLRRRVQLTDNVMVSPRSGRPRRLSKITIVTFVWHRFVIVCERQHH